MRIKSLVSLMIAIALVGCGGAAARKSGYMAKGQGFLAAHNYAKARLEFRNALQLDPNDAEASYLAGQAAQHLGEIREAAAMYQGAIQSNPNHLGARAQLGLIYAMGGAPDKAMAAVEPGLVQAPDDPDLLTARAAARLRLGDSAKARLDAEKAARLAPANENTVGLLASIYQQAGETPQAIDLVNKALQTPGASDDLHVVLAQLYLTAHRNPDAVQELERAIAAEPDKLIHRYQLARVLLLDKNVGAAEAALRGAVAEAPTNAEAKLILANMLAANRSYEVAEAELNRLSASSPKDYQLRLGFGQFYASHGKTPEAQAVYRQIIQGNGTGPFGLIARNRLIAIALGANQLDDASGLVAEVLKKNPRDNDALYARASVSLARGNSDAAITDLRSVQRDQPTSVQVQRALANAYLQNDDATLAEETLRSATQGSPNNVDLRFDLAKLLMKTGHNDQALPILDKLAGEQPTNLPVLEALFATQLARKDYTAARRTAMLVQSAKPELPTGNYLTGVAEMADGKQEAARAAFERASAIAPAAVDPVTALVRLDLVEQHPDQALARLDKIIVQYPKNALPHNLKGEVLAGLKRTDPAIASFRDAIALSPAWINPYGNLAAAQAASGHTEAAVAALQDGNKATHDAPVLVFSLAELLARQGRIDDAIAAYDGLLKRDANNVVAANNLAMLLVTYRSDRASLDRARALTDRFVSSRNAALLDTRGWVLFKRGDYADALGALQKSVDKAPQAPELLYHLGMAQLKSGARDSARRSLELALDGNVAFADSDAAKETLASL